jgi:hypothetical protein
MKRIPVRLRRGQLVVAEWLDAAGADIEKGKRLMPVKVKTVGWVWERSNRFLTIHSELFLSGHVEGDARDGTTITAEMLRRVRVLADVGET